MGRGLKGGGEIIMYAALGVQAVNSECPAGKNVRYEDVFEELQSEIDKLASPAGRDSFEWKTVAGLSSTILKDFSKDILVASYLSVSLINLEGAKGLDAASDIYLGILENYWETLFPPKKRMRGRISAVQWWVENIEKAIKSEINLKITPEAAKSTLDRFKRIDKFLQEHIEIEISLLPLIRQIENILLENKPAGNIQGEVSGGEKPGKINQIKGVDDIAGISIASAKEAIKSMTPFFQKIKQAAKVVRGEELQNPQPYRWLRFAIWESVKHLPLDVDGVTKIPPPSHQIINHIKALKSEENWSGVINASESALFNSRNIFLLDLNFFTAGALLKLGKKYEPALRVTCRETEHFVERLPGLENLAFSDGSPFASDEAREWLGQLRGLGTRNVEVDVSVEVSNGEKAVLDEIEKATAMAKEKEEIYEAVAHLQNKINSSLSMKEAMILRLGLVHILMAEKNEKVVTPHIELILNDVLEYRLNRWEPELALKSLKIVYRAFTNHSDKAYKKKTDEVLRMIAGINTVEAMRL